MLVTDDAANRREELLTLVKSLYNYYVESREYFEYINNFEVVPEENELASQVWSVRR